MLEFSAHFGSFYVCKAETDGWDRTCWAIVSATFLVSGIAVSTDAATYLWNGAKSVVLFAFAVFVVIILFLFKISMAVSVVVVKNQELAMQVSLLNQENERILQELKGLVDEKENIVRD